MRHIDSWAAIVAMALVLCPALSQPVLTLAFAEWPPYEYVEDGRFKGSDVELIAAAAHIAGFEVSFVCYPWARCQMLARQKAIDGVFSVAYSESRAEFLTYHDEPLSFNENVLFVPKGSSLRFSRIEDLAGRVIGIGNGYAYGEEFDASTLFTREASAEDTTGIRKLLAGRTEAHICDKAVGQRILGQLGLEDRVVWLPKPISETALFVGFTKKQGNELYARKFSDALAALKASGRYAQIQRAYFR